MHRCIRTGLATVTLLGLTAAVTGQEADPLIRTGTGTETGATESRPGAHAITLHRPAVVGQTTRIHGEGTQQRTLTTVVDEVPQTVEHHEASIIINARMEVLAVDDHGRPTVAAYTASRCQMTTGDTTVDVVPRNATFMARRDGTTTVFEIDGEPITGLPAEALRMVAGLDAGVMLEDEVMGTSEPKMIGDSWTINVGNAITDIAGRTGRTIGESDVSGSSWLVRSREHDEQPCLVVRSRLTTENVVPGETAVPEGFTVNGATMTVDTERYLPIDAALPALRRAVTLNVDATVSGPHGAEGGITEMRLNGSQRVHVDTEVISVPDGTVVTLEETASIQD